VTTTDCAELAAEADTAAWAGAGAIQPAVRSETRRAPATATAHLRGMSTVRAVAMGMEGCQPPAAITNRGYPQKPVKL
jgi:hypothetical protein